MWNISTIWIASFEKKNKAESFHQRIGLEVEEETGIVLHLDVCLLWF
jgi:hypothetical protein